MKRISIITSAVLLACSCMTERIGDPTYVDTAREDTVDVEFRITSRDSSATRSSISASETEIEDINIYAYSGGRLENETYIDSPKSVSLSLARGKTYNLYALSNIGRHEAPVSEDELLDLKLSMGYMSSIDGGFPMSWSKTGHMVSAAASGVDVTLVRLVSRIRLSLDRSELENFRVRAVRLCQSALCVCPFTASRAESRYEVGNGDYASSSDLSTLNAGGEISFYAYENRQGVLLPNNKNAESKIPDSIPANAELCTYLELSASYSGEYEGVDVSSDNVKYRFYLGEDNCTDFNVTRNKDIRVNLKVTEERIFDESWRISYGNDLPSVSYALECSSTSSSLDVGESRTVSATYVQTVDGVRNTETDVTAYAAWSSSNTGVATVSGGKITATGAGSTTISVTYNGYRATHTVKVSDALTYSLSVSLSDSSIKVGEKTTAKATYKTYSNGILSDSRDVTSSATWSSGSSSVATVSGGTVTAMGAGTASIRASYGGETASASLTVTDNVTNDYQLSPSSVNLVNGRSNKLTVIRRTFINGVQSNGEDFSSVFSWTSSNTSVATVGSDGVVTGTGAGTATITARYGGTTLTASVTVTPEYTYELVLDRTSLDLAKGGSGSLEATYRTYADGTLQTSLDVTADASWSSSSTSVATVSSGTVTGNGLGSATVTATYNGKSASCTVKVTGSPTLSLGWTSADLKKGDVRTNAAIYNPNDGTASGNVSASATWTTSNAGVATVTEGTITAHGKGTCTITATYKGVSARCTVNVTENDAPGMDAYVSNVYVESVNIPGSSSYKLKLSLRFSDGTTVDDVPYTWRVTFAQNSSIPTGPTGTGPLIYLGGGSTYSMAVVLTTVDSYLDNYGNMRQQTTGTSFSHNTSWAP